MKPNFPHNNQSHSQPVYRPVQGDYNNANPMSPASSKPQYSSNLNTNSSQYKPYSAAQNIAVLKQQQQQSAYQRQYAASQQRP